MALENFSPENDKVDLGNLYRQETYTDLGLGSIQCLRPITAEGENDPGRDPIFMGTAQIMTPHGPIPVQCEIKNATTLRAACEAFPQAIKDAVEDLVEQAKQIERERQGGIVIPRGGKLELP
ncbi:MAG: cytoplasmic protein [Planctomycetes bacterium]|nr:cytoplasmic protein [Planctomycetota bacterium]